VLGWAASYVFGINKSKCPYQYFITHKRDISTVEPAYKGMLRPSDLIRKIEAFTGKPSSGDTLLRIAPS
jgi:hypothetical protein